MPRYHYQLPDLNKQTKLKLNSYSHCRLLGRSEHVYILLLLLLLLLLLQIDTCTVHSVTVCTQYKQLNTFYGYVGKPSSDMKCVTSGLRFC
jgi:hypothetical protein